MKGLEDVVRGRIKKIMKEKDLLQKDFLQLCGRFGEAPSQSTFSKLMAGKQSLSVEYIELFAKALGVSYACLFGEDNNAILLERDTLGFRVEPMDPDNVFQGYMGEFHVYFYAPSQTERGRILEGKLCIYKENSICRARLELFFKQQQSQNKTSKLYYGQLIMSTGMGSAYINLTNNEIGDFGSLVFRYRRFRSGELELRLGLALTASAGDFNSPTAHYMLLSRDEIDKKQLNVIAGAYLVMSSEYYFLLENDCQKLQGMQNKQTESSLYDQWIEKYVSCLAISRKDMNDWMDKNVDNKDRVSFTALLNRLSLGAAPTEFITQEKEKELYSSVITETKFIKEGKEV